MNIFKANKNFDRYCWLILYANIFNVVWFFLSTYLEDNFFERSYIFTLIGYQIIFSTISTILESKPLNKTLFFFKIFCFIFCFSWAMIFSFFISVYMMLGDFLAYSVLVLVYLSLFSVLLAKILSLKITFSYIGHQVIIILVTVGVYNLLDGVQAYDFGVQVLLSIWLFLILLHITYQKLSMFSQQSSNFD